MQDCSSFTFSVSGELFVLTYDKHMEGGISKGKVSFVFLLQTKVAGALRCLRGPYLPLIVDSYNLIANIGSVAKFSLKSYSFV